MPGIHSPTFHPILALALALALVLAAPAFSNEQNEESAVEKKEVLPVENMNNMVASDGEHVYLFGGRTSETTASRDVLRIDPVTLEVEFAGNLPIARAAGSVAYLQGKFYVFGGMERAAGNWVASDRIVEYDPQTEQSQQLTVAKLPNSLFNTAAASDGQRIYIFGGYRFDPPDRRDRIIEFDPSSTLTPVQTLTPRLPYPVDSASAVYDGERFLVVGGLGDSGVRDSIIGFNSGTQSVSTEPYTLPQGLRTSAAGVHNGTTYVFGGGTTNGLDTGTDAIVKLNGTAASTVNATLQEPRLAAGVGIVDDHAYLVGGRTAAKEYTRDITRIDLARLHLYTPEPEEKEEAPEETEDEEDKSQQENQTEEEQGDEGDETPTETESEGDPVESDSEDGTRDDAPSEKAPGPPVMIVLLFAIVAIAAVRGRLWARR